MKINWLSIAIAGVMLLAACSPPQAVQPQSTPQAPEKTITPQLAPAAVLTDLAGREIEVRGVPQRIVSLLPAATEILFALSKGGAVLAVDPLSELPEGSLLERVEPFAIASISGFNPDIVFVGKNFSPSACEELIGDGIQVVYAEASSFGEIYAAIALLAQITGTDAAELIEGMQKEVMKLSALAAELEPLNVFFALQKAGEGYAAAGSGSLEYELLQLAGGQPVLAKPNEEYPVYSLEELAAVEPDVMLLSAELNYEDFVEQDELAKLECVEQGRVFKLEQAVVPGPSVIKALRHIYEALEMALIS
ncbi:MAG: corrinoid ABC transporter substrate-binding protein [Firmicutes bacterium ADurb.Bin356]|nr:MAG: corrinoid ABC transporter substrate-binding protein [Firmicutes bacterium ADurb.Bin356]